MFLLKHPLWRILVSAAFLSTMLSADPIADVTRSFVLEAGDAGTTLKLFAKQAELSIVYDPRIVKGVETNVVVGLLIPQDALERMLAGTLLVFDEDSETGAFAVTRSEIPSLGLTHTTPETPTIQDNRMNAKKNNLLNTIAVMLTLGIGGGQTNLSGQENDSVGPTVDLDEFVVESGIAASQQRSVEVKRASTSFIDAISAEGLGRFPDENVAESLQRISGVQINRNRGEGRTVNIRGLPSNFTFVMFNGRTLSSALGAGPDNQIDRSFDFTTLPSEFVSTLKVYKTPTADMEEGGLSGTIDVETASAFDIGDRSVAASVQGAWESNSGEISPRASLLFSDIFAEGKVGLSVGVAYTKREPETHSNNGGFTNRTESQGLQSSGGPVDFNGDGVIDPNLTVRVPGGQFLNIYKEERVRESTIASLEFRPSDNVDFFVEAFYSKLDVESIRYENLHRWINAQGIDPTGSTLVENLGPFNYTTIIDGTGVDLRGGSRFEDREGDILSLSAGGEYRGESWTISGEISKSDSKQFGDNLNIADIARGSIKYDNTLSSDGPAVTYEDGFEEGRFDPNNFQLASLNGGFQRERTDDLYDARIDFEKQTDWNVLNAIKFGAKLSNRKQDGDNGRLVIGGSAFSDLVGGLPEGPGGPGTFSAAPFMQLIESGNGSFLSSFSGHKLFPQTWLGSDTRSFLENYTDDELIAAGNFTNAVTGIVDVEEDVLAGYLMAEFKTDDGHVSGNFGVRAVKTDQTSIGNAPDITKITLEPEAGAVTTIPPGEDVSVDRSYTELLPSANLRIDITDDVVMRFSASRTMARPNLTQISPITTANGNSQTITRQNPSLDPFLANNFDLSAEWYFSDDGIFSFSAFHKDIVSLIRNETSTVDLPITILLSDGTSFIEDREFTVNEPVNGGGVNVKGFEMTFQQPLGFLPVDGFGVLANYTFIDNSDPLQLTAASEHNYNVSGYFERERIGIRLSYTWRDGFLTNPGTATGDGTMADAYGVLDGNITYKINQNLSLVLEAINIMDEADVSRTLTGLPTSYFDSGRRVLLGARASF